MIKPVRPEVPIPTGKQPAYSAITSLILSITGILFLFTAVAGIILGAMELNRIKNGHSSSKGKKIALAGVIVGASVLALDLIATLIILAR